MKSKWFAAMPGQFLTVALALLFSATTAQAGESVILRFNQTLGANPSSGLVSDAAGNLYGTTTLGGTANCGTVFELSPGSDGKWAETLLYSFPSCAYPPGLFVSGTMVFDKEGNLYGVAENDDCCQDGGGFVFRLSKGANGTWSGSVIYRFTAVEGYPQGDLATDSADNLYGVTYVSSATSYGEVFELSPQPGASWKETILYTFPATNGVGAPAAGVTFDSKGNLYGPANEGYIRGTEYGAVYELSPQANGPWRLRVLHNFHGNQGSSFESRLVFDSSGNLYGTATQPNSGLVFELSPTPGGQWTETVIHAFENGGDGRIPQGTLVVDASGNVYGATEWGGLGCNGFYCGVVYRLSPQGGGTWKETILHPFESAEDGSQPGAGLLLDSSGNLFGTTYHGGSRYGYGTVYEITP
jgi:uncharacterized repeat protein (TIGR03803 family)